MGQCVFEYVIDEFVDTFGSIDMVDMTPMDGELTLTPEWMSMLDYLYENTDVERFEFVTNFLDYDKKTIYKLLKYREKFGLFISVYGHDRISFLENTGVDGWSRFIESITNLQECLAVNEYECFPITFYFRDTPYEDLSKDFFISKFLRALQLVSKNDVVFDSSMAGKNYNWAGQVQDIPNQIPLGDNKGVCLHAVLQNCVLQNGDITLCGMVDINKELIIGNIFATPLKDIYGKDSIYASYIMHMPELCKKCTEYEAKTDDEDVRLHEDKLNKIR